MLWISELKSMDSNSDAQYTNIIFLNKLLIIYLLLLDLLLQNCSQLKVKLLMECWTVVEIEQGWIILPDYS